MRKALKVGETEMRFYTDSGNFTYCSGGRYACSCFSEKVNCNNTFYIGNGIIQNYEPAGSCYQKETQLPQDKYRRNTEGQQYLTLKTS